MNKKIIFSLALLYIFLLNPTNALVFADYEISTWYHLDSVRENTGLGKHFILINNLDQYTAGYNDVVDPSGIGFIPIDLQGVFDGSGYQIKDLYISYQANPKGPLGLFGTIDSRGHVRNLGLVNAIIDGVDPTDNADNYYANSNKPAGTIAGVNYGSISDSYVTGINGKVRGLVGVGGLVGLNKQDSHISNSYSTVAVQSDLSLASGLYGAGGLIGDNSGWVMNSYSTGSVTSGGGGFVGGLIGYNDAVHAHLSKLGYAGSLDSIGYDQFLYDGPMSVDYEHGSPIAFYDINHPIYSSWDSVLNGIPYTPPNYPALWNFTGTGLPILIPGRMYSLNIRTSFGGRVENPVYINPNSNSTLSFKDGSLVNLLASADHAYKFSHWSSVDGSSLDVGNINDTSITMTIDKNINLVANFEDVVRNIFIYIEGATDTTTHDYDTFVAEASYQNQFWQPTTVDGDCIYCSNPSIYDSKLYDIEEIKILSTRDSSDYGWWSWPGFVDANGTELVSILIDIANNTNVSSITNIVVAGHSAGAIAAWLYADKDNIISIFPTNTQISYIYFDPPYNVRWSFSRAAIWFTTNLLNMHDLIRFREARETGISSAVLEVNNWTNGYPFGGFGPSPELLSDHTKFRTEWGLLDIISEEMNRLINDSI